ncbi:MAG: phage holin family protein [Actinomycetota bacterium]|nr:phage holin family protein [Actinomycetota bacterium]
MNERPTEDDWYRGTDAPTVVGNSGAASGNDGVGSASSGSGSTGGSSKSAGQLMKEISEDFSTLFRKEIELAKTELGQSIAEKAKGAAIIAIAGVLGFFALIFLLLAIRDGLDNLLWRWLADIVTAVILLIIGAVAALLAKKKLTKPVSTELTKQTIKEDVEWAKTLGKQ